MAAENTQIVRRLVLRYFQGIGQSAQKNRIPIEIPPVSLLIFPILESGMEQLNFSFPKTLNNLCSHQARSCAMAEEIGNKKGRENPALFDFSAPPPREST